MKSIGSTLLLLGIGSIVLNQIDYEFKLLMWIDNWGEMVGWAIRGGMIAAGAALYFLAPSPETAQGDEEAAEAE